MSIQALRVAERGYRDVAERDYRVAALNPPIDLTVMPAIRGPPTGALPRPDSP